MVGAAVANVAIVPVGADGTFCVYVSSAMHLAVDVMGTFTADGQLQFLPITPVRVHDSRPPAVRSRDDQPEQHPVVAGRDHPRRALPGPTG